MSDIAIRVENLGKKYRIGQRKDRRYKTLRDALSSLPRRILLRSGLSTGSSHSKADEFWALQDVSFEISQGEAVGVIGRNGAGKSTLLKLLSRITQPTTGTIEIVGRMSSLLEVGTGFHPELTGRENIFLNGAILGMSRVEIKARFDEIVAFAEVERFLDTPVKHYSSGMYVRLAFAVAAHLDPDIMILDEVLAVGDLEFQKKCLKKMETATGQQGRTVLFVSHNMDLITKLCSKAVLLEHGRVATMGDVEHITREYIARAGSRSGEFVSSDSRRCLRSVRLDTEQLLKGRLVIHVGFGFTAKLANATFGIVVYNESGSPVFGSNTMYHPPTSRPKDDQSGEATVSFDSLPLWSGVYTISVWLSDGWSPIDDEANAITFDYVAAEAPLNAPSFRYVGSVHLPATWNIKS